LTSIVALDLARPPPPRVPWHVCGTTWSAATRSSVTPHPGAWQL